MAGVWVKKRVLIVVRTYPTPAKSTIEASCTAAISERQSMDTYVSCSGAFDGARQEILGSGSGLMSAF